MREFGVRQPIVVDPDGVIICGHTRYKAAPTLTRFGDSRYLFDIAS